MARYSTNTSDKSKKVALLFWLLGGIGILGLENIYVCKFKKGAIRILFGIFILLAIYAMKEEPAAIPVGLIFWAIVSLPNFFKIIFGIFRDNVGAPLRQ